MSNREELVYREWAKLCENIKHLEMENKELKKYLVNAVANQVKRQ